MNTQGLKELAEFLFIFKAAYPYLTADDKTTLTQLLPTWASRKIVKREVADNAQGART